MTRLRTKLVKNLTRQEYMKLRRLIKKRLGTTGMRGWLDYLYKYRDVFREENAEARVWWYEQDGRVLAWSMLHHSIPPSRDGWTEEDAGWWGNVYVRAGKSGEYRRREYGTRLLAKMAARQPSMHVSPYTPESRSFYAANGFDRLLTGYSLVRS